MNCDSDVSIRIIINMIASPARRASPRATGQMTAQLAMPLYIMAIHELHARIEPIICRV